MTICLCSEADIMIAEELTNRVKVITPRVNLNLGPAGGKTEGKIKPTKRIVTKPSTPGIR